MMNETPSPRKVGVREFVGGFGLMAMGFGMFSWLNGRVVPWGYQQTFGAAAFAAGLLGVVAAWAFSWKRFSNKE